MKVNVSMLLGILFIYLKLTHQIDWAWWAVTLPIWGPSALTVAVFLVLGISALIVAAL